jgi:hypothetical protein
MHSLRWISLVLVVVVGCGCNPHPASTGECEAILQRLVELELSEPGYRDPVLLTLWQQDLVRRFAPYLDRCRGREVPNSLRDCLTASVGDRLGSGCRLPGRGSKILKTSP